MIESVFVIILVCLCFLAIFQYANLFAAKAVLSHAATRAARARAVGFNRWMVEKSARVAAIPASGRRLVPPSAGLDPAITAALGQNRVGAVWDLALRSSGRSPGIALELGRVPDYMDSDNDPTAGNILDYELWEALSVDIEEPLDLDGTTPGILRVTVRQRHPLLLALAALAEGELRDPEGEEIALEGFYNIESHYPLYMEDMNW
ncbi:MAG TPA: TadE/TadG family type IV pilus assembly protein [Kiritimatiellia bacterium]|nr:TadE/TadG family type IV pilus assembly protein [Kiritimatiellia bacterium]HPS09283.1 TadE/TadG family type IV pilus assembly protein [Kiritimatiellia bacterium]